MNIQLTTSTFRAALCSLALAMATTATAFAQQYHYVLASATGNNTGSSWANAYTSLQTALAAAQPGDVIYVGQGTYLPSATADATASFTIPANVTLYGGFAGTETVDQAAIDARDFTSHTTVLSGDLLGNDATAFTNRDDNTHHLVQVANATGAVLNGFTLRGGNSSAPGSAINFGGAIYAENAGLTLAHLTIEDNKGYNGAFYASNSTVVLEDSELKANTGNNGHAAAIKFISSTQATLRRVTIKDNTDGPALNALSGTQLTAEDLTVTGNSNGSGGSPEGAAFLLAGVDATLTGGLIAHNSSAAGPGAGLYAQGIGRTITLRNVTLTHNTATTHAGIYADKAALDMTNVLLWGNSGSTELSLNNGATSTASHSLLQGSGGSASWNTAYGTDGGNNVDADPQFADAAASDFRLLEESPAQGTGNSTHGPNMGWYQLGGANSLYVWPAATGNGVGDSWANAKTTVQDALVTLASYGGGTVYIAIGNYKASTTRDATESFVIPANTTIYGGVAAGVEPTQAVLDSRPYTAGNNTIFTGDLKGDDDPRFRDREENSHHVFRVEDVQDVVLDGIIIQAGNSLAATHNEGSAIYVKNAGLSLLNSRIRDNQSQKGALYAESANLTIDNCQFTGNNGEYGFAAAISLNLSTVANASQLLMKDNDDAVALQVANNCQVTIDDFDISGNDNTTSNGSGGVYSENSTLTLANGRLNGNKTKGSGGALHVELSANNTCHIYNVTAVGNWADGHGGGLYIPSLAQPIRLTNVILFQNNAGLTTQNPNLYLNYVNTPVELDHTLVEGISADIGTVAFTDLGGNIDTDPYFAPGTINLLTGSPALGTGNATFGANMGWYQGSGVPYSQMNTTAEQPAIEADEAAKTLAVYPNPNRGRFTIALEAAESSTVQYTLVDAMGRMALQQEAQAFAGANEVAVDLTGLQPGLYVLYAQINGQRHIQKVLVQ